MANDGFMHVGLHYLKPTPRFFVLKTELVGPILDHKAC